MHVDGHGLLEQIVHAHGRQLGDRLAVHHVFQRILGNRVEVGAGAGVDMVGLRHAFGPALDMDGDFDALAHGLDQGVAGFTGIVLGGKLDLQFVRHGGGKGRCGSKAEQGQGECKFVHGELQGKGH